MINNPAGSPYIINGEHRYDKILKKMTPEEKAAHLAERKVRKEKKMKELSRRQAFEEVLNAQKAQWVAEANNIMVAQVRKAKEGDTQAFNAVMAYLIGKPETQIDITSGGNELKAPTLIFTPKGLDDWTE